MKTNSTSSFEINSAATAIQLSLCLALIVVGVLGNGTIWFVLKRFKPLRTIPNISLANLAAIDLSNIIVNVPLFIAYHVYEEGTFNTSSASWWTTFLWVLFIDLNTTSMLILVLDRYSGIVHGLKYNLWKTRRKASCTICTSWILAHISKLCQPCTPNMFLNSRLLYAGFYCFITASTLNYIITICSRGRRF